MHETAVYTAALGIILKPAHQTTMRTRSNAIFRHPHLQIDYLKQMFLHRPPVEQYTFRHWLHWDKSYIYWYSEDVSWVAFSSIIDIKQLATCPASDHPCTYPPPLPRFSRPIILPAVQRAAVHTKQSSGINWCQGWARASSGRANRWKNCL